MRRRVRRPSVDDHPTQLLSKQGKKQKRWLKKTGRSTGWSAKRMGARTKLKTWTPPNAGR